MKGYDFSIQIIGAERIDRFCRRAWWELMDFSWLLIAKAHGVSRWGGPREAS